MYNVQFNKIVTKKNIERNFFFYALLNDKKLIKYFFVNIWLFIQGYLKKDYKEYHIKKYQYLKTIKKPENLIKKYIWKKECLSNWYKSNENVVEIIFEKTPSIFTKFIIKDKKTICYELDDNYLVSNYDEVNEKIKQLNNVIIKNKNYLDNTRIYNNVYFKKFSYIKYKSIHKNKQYSELKNLFILGVSSVIIGLISLLFATANYDMTIYFSFFKSEYLLFLNILPVTILMFLLYFICKRVWLSYLLSSILILTLSIVNKIKLFCRDDVFIFNDLLLFEEASIMSQNYDTGIGFLTILILLLASLLTVILFGLCNNSKLKIWKRLICLFVLLFFSNHMYNNVYINEETYSYMGDTSIINVWIGTRQFQIRGFLYPFIHSSKDLLPIEPIGYNKTETENLLDKFEDDEIPADKKINIIAIMLEAYNDFSQFDSIEFTKDIYEPFHEIQEEGYSGKLVTTIFGGGTIVSERNFITGNYFLSNYRSQSDSFARYFNDNGYYTVSMHPIYGSFYNRISVNENLGFQDYFHYDNKYSTIQDSFFNDDLFFDDIYNNYIENIEKPYFNFSITYQNHGPYFSEYIYGDTYIENDNMNKISYNLFNNYLDGIYSTNLALEKLVDDLQELDEPTVLLLYGDHNPYLGENNTTFTELGINVDLNTLDGYLNYYTTPFVIWTNDAASDFVNENYEQKEYISPMFLMSEMFNYVGLDGNQHLKYLNSVSEVTPVLNETYYYIDNSFVLTRDYDNQKILNEFEKVNYYYNYDALS